MLLEYVPQPPPQFHRVSSCFTPLAVTEYGGQQFALCRTGFTGIASLPVHRFELPHLAWFPADWFPLRVKGQGPPNGFRVTRVGQRRMTLPSSARMKNPKPVSSAGDEMREFAEVWNYMAAEYIMYATQMAAAEAAGA